MNRPRVQLSVQISLFVEKDEEEAGEKKKCLNNAIFRPISLISSLSRMTYRGWQKYKRSKKRLLFTNQLAETSGTLKRPLGRLGY